MDPGFNFPRFEPSRQTSCLDIQYQFAPKSNQKEVVYHTIKFSYSHIRKLKIVWCSCTSRLIRKTPPILFVVMHTIMTSSSIQLSSLICSVSSHCKYLVLPLRTSADIDVNKFEWVSPTFPHHRHLLFLFIICSERLLV